MMLADLMLGNLLQDTRQSHQNADPNQHNVDIIQQFILARVAIMLTTLGPSSPW
jgi:hypothetical protein